MYLDYVSAAFLSVSAVCGINNSGQKLCQFDDEENFVEVYDTKHDPFELQNLYCT